VNQQLQQLQAALGDRYPIDREIGSGGMATVYLADDGRHHRKVALKVLRPELAQTLGPERFFREIEIAAQLQHPNILPLLDSGEAAGFLYYVMPYVDGPSLRDRLANQGELPVHDAVKILTEVVDALAEAHAKGIVHRDIKPDNVLLTGRHALVTDFGVAKAVNEATGRQALTTAGVALGTPSYMAPEQASADPNIDHRVDIYAVGAVAYEMLTGRPPFTGTSAQQILAAHMTEEPRPPRERRGSISPQLEQIVLKCLAKHPADRWQSAEELLHELETVATPSGGMTPTDTRPVRGMPGRTSGRRTGWQVVVGALVIGIALFVLLRPHGGLTPVTLGETRQVTLDEGLELDPALSPDGRFVAYAAGPTGSMRIYVRSLAGGTPVMVSGDLRGEHRMPRWSPDGSSVLFTAGFSMYVVPALGGAPRAVVTPASGGGRYGTWAPDGQRVAYSAGNTSRTRLIVVDVSGANPRTVVEDFDIHTPAWSPDGRYIAYVSGNFQYMYGTTVLGNLGPSAIYVVPADGGDAGGNATAITDREYLNTSPAWAPDSKSLFFVSTREGGRDIYRIAIDGSGHAAGAGQRLTTGLRAGTISLTADGTALAYSVFTNTANVWSIRIPSSGPVSVSEATPVTTGTQHIEGMAVSHDGRWLAFDSDRGGNVDIYKERLDGGDPIQLTTDPSDDFLPAWSRDDREIAFHSWRNGNRDLYVMSSDGGAETQLTTDSAQDFYPDWSPDGTTIAFHSDRTGQSLIYTMTRSNGGWSQPRAVSTRSGTQAKWSPDGTRILFVCGGLCLVQPDGTGERQVLEPFEGDGSRWAAGYAVWSPDGGTIYFKAATQDGRHAFWSVPSSGGTPRLLVRFDDPDRPSGRQEFATDGTRLYFTVDNRQADIWVVKLETGG